MKNSIPRVRVSIVAAALLAGTSTPAFTHVAKSAVTRSHAQTGAVVTPVFDRELPNVPGKSLVAVEVVYPPGAASPPHRHPRSAFIYAYVISGEVVSAVDDEQPRVYRAGEGWSEAPGAHHRVSRNGSKTKPAKMLAVFVKQSGGGPLVFPDRK